MGLEERRKRDRENRKRTILKAARRLFLMNGFKTVTVENIARTAELSKGSIYLYYNSKEEIYTQILLNDIDKFHNRIKDILKNGISAEKALLRLSDIYLEFFLNERELFRILMTFMLHTKDMKLPEDISKHIIKSTNRSVDVIEKIIQYGIDRGEFDGKLDLRRSRNALWGMMNGIISMYLFTGAEEKRADAIHRNIRTGLEIFLRGFAR